MKQRVIWGADCPIDYAAVSIAWRPTVSSLCRLPSNDWCGRNVTHETS